MAALAAVKAAAWVRDQDRALVRDMAVASVVVPIALVAE